MIYDNVKFYGPYRRKDGREHLVYKDSDGKHRSLSYPKYLMEVHLGRYLEEDETVDHIDEDFSNNSLDNLRIVSRKHNASRSAIRNKAKTFDCPNCNIGFSLEGTKLSKAISNRKRGSAGPFCSKSCAGSYSKNVQLNIEEKIEVKEIVCEKYKTLD